MVLNPAWGVCPCSGDGIRTARSVRRTPPCPGPARYSARGLVRTHPRTRPPRESLLLAPGDTRCLNGTGQAGPEVYQRPVRPAREPFRFAFFNRLSYWCEVRCAWICAMKSITTTTTISSEVPPK